MSDQSAPANAPADATRSADTADGGWTVESHSAPSTPAPEDTTVSPQGIDNEPPAAVARPEGEARETTETSASAGTEAAAEAQKPAGRPAKKKQTFQERIDELTGQRKGVERELATEREARLALERRLAALEKGSGKPAETPTAKPAEAKPAAPAPAPFPEPPKYADFVTDEEYQAAYTKWRTEDVPAWEKTRAEALKTEITSSLDERLQRERAEAARHAHESAVMTRVGQMLQANPQAAANLQAKANAELYRSIDRENTPLLMDLIENHTDGAEFYKDLAESPDMARALVALPVPSRPLADALRQSPAARALMQHFATEDGREDFLRLRSLHPVRVLAEVGKLEVRLDTADRGPVAGAPHPITSAVPPAKPPVGSPRARATAPSGEPPFEDWMADEDRKEEAERRRRAGLSATA